MGGGCDEDLVQKRAASFLTIPGMSCVVLELC